MARKTVIAVIEVPDGWLDDPDAGTRVGIQVWVPALAENKEAEILFAVVHEGGEMAEDHGFDPAAFEDEDEDEEGK